MDAKCTGSQWFSGGAAADPSSNVNFHHVANQQQQQQQHKMLADDEEDELNSMLLPDLHGTSDVLEQKHVKELSKYLPARAEGYSWTLAFTTTTMGFSLKSLYRSLSRYEGPVLLIIKDNEGSVFGAFSSCSLRPSESFYGTGETYLFTFKQPKQSITSSSATETSTTTTNAAAVGGGTSTSDVITTTIKSSNNLLDSNINSNNYSGGSDSGSRSSSSISNSSSSIIKNQQQQQKHNYFERFPWTGDNLYFIKGNPDSLAFGAGEGNFGLCDANARLFWFRFWIWCSGFGVHGDGCRVILLVVVVSVG
ncbi:Hypothetical predicted protein, partial [Olea europaea subsp. europaea]